MKLIVDSGSTKADWIALTDDDKVHFTTQTLGLNPEVLEKDEIISRLNERFDIAQNREKATSLYFYGAGCGTARMRNFLTEVFKAYFPNAQIHVHEDTYAAVYATTPKGQKAIVCILGTGSNCCYYDGREIHQRVQSLGYIPMDDCSGSQFGRQLLRAYFFKLMPQPLSEKFEQAHDVDPDVIKNHLYKQPNPNAYLASFAKFLIANKQDAFLQTMIRAGMEDFVRHYIRQYPEHLEVPVHFIGSIAFYLREELAEVLGAHGIQLGNVLRRPIDGLIAYHSHV